MPAGPDYIFAFQNKTHSFWQPDGSGSITISNQPYFHEFSPDGWNGIAIQNVRNKRLWGIDRTVSIPLSYVQDAAHILKYIFYNLGIEENVYLVIAKQELDYTPGVGYGYWYKQLYRGEVDLSTFLHAGSKITCTTLEDGLPKFLKANENTTYEFPMNVPEAINVKMDGIRLHEKLNYADVSGLEVSLAFLGQSFFGPYNFIAKEGDSVGFAIDSQVLEGGIAGLTWDDKLLKTNTILTNVGITTVEITIAGKIEFICTGMTSSPPYAVRFSYLRSNQLLADQNDYLIISTPGMVVGQTYSTDFSFTIPLAPGERLYRQGTFFGGVGSDAKIEFTDNSTSSISFITRQTTTYIKAFRAQYLWNLLINKVTEGEYTGALCEYFSRYTQKVFTCGNAIRGLADPIMKISLTDFFHDWDCFDSVGIIETNGMVTLDTKSSLIDTTKVIRLSAPAEGSFKVAVAKEYLFNEAEFGYPEIRNEVGVLNGNEEYNCKYLWSIGATKSPAKLDKVSKIKTSCYEIELIRVTTFTKDTTDNKSDNDLFSLYIEKDSNPGDGLSIPLHYNLDRSLNATATGLIEPETVFNIPLSPKRNLLRNGPFLRSSLYLADNRIFAYQSCDKNNKVVADGIIEKADVPISSLGEKFFEPLLLEGEIPAPDNLESLLDFNPLTIFEFPVDGTYFKGILQKVSVEPSSRKTQQYIFLNLPSNDRSKLIEYYG